MSSPPLLELALNAESVVNETVLLIRSARLELETTMQFVRQEMHNTLEDVDGDIAEILKNAAKITANVSRSTASFSPAILILCVVVFLLVLLLLATCILCRARSEYRKHPIRLWRKKKRPQVLLTQTIQPETSPRPRDSFRASMV